MTPAATPEALADLIARLRATNPWKKTAIAEDLMREAADALQRVTADREVERADYERGLEHRNNLYDTVLLLRISLAAAKSREDTATAEAASLRAEVEALVHAIDMARAEVAFAQQDEADGSSHASRRVRFQGILDALNGTGNPAAHTALARAATAGEGRSDG